MSESSYNPRYQTPGYPIDNGVEFHGPNGLITIDGYQKEILTILTIADGTRDASAIVEGAVEKGIDVNVANAIIGDLTTLGILGDSRAMHKWFHSYTTNPSMFNHALSTQDIKEITSRNYIAEKIGETIILPTVGTKLTETFADRKSVRSFDSMPVELPKIGEILVSTYSLDSKPTPSAGGLYPLKIYIIVGENQEIPAGYYQYNPNDESLIMFDDNFDTNKLQYIFNSDSLVHNAPLLMVIAGDLDRHPEKYANRGYRYTLIEAGHAAQNVQLVSTELGLSTLEYGGFNDIPLKEELQLEDSIFPIITLAIGYESNNPVEDSVSTFAKLETELVGKDKPVEYVGVNIHSEAVKGLGFYHATAHYNKPNASYLGDKDERFTSGTATSMHLAQIKAIAEAYERYASGEIIFDIRDTANNLTTPWLDPRKIRPIDDEQLRTSWQLKRFSEDMVIEWINSTEIKTGNNILVPIDIVLYPLSENELGRKLIAQADSSGVAAYTNRDVAIEKGLLELIERDAIMRNWFAKEPFPRIAHDILSPIHQERIKYWDALGYIVDVIDMTENDIVVVNVVIRNKDKVYPYFSNGASASKHYGEAIQKALEEAELGITYAIHNPKEDMITAESISAPSGHGIYYLHPENSNSIDWLWAGEINSNYKFVDNSTNIIDKYNPLVIDLGKNRGPLHVVRVIEPSLVPISFGYRSEYYMHPNSGVDVASYSPDSPHYFA
jgi:thiazole/oxazole-forming peptide maturase SagD family component